VPVDDEEHHPPDVAEQAVQEPEEDPGIEVDHWWTADQKHRWLAAALLDIEPRLRRIKGFQAVPLLRQALQAQLRGEVRTTGTQAA
jgi:hypothetical protein